MSRGGPPLISTTFSFDGAKKPIDKLSGDQNGQDANPVPARGLASRESSERTHNVIVPFSAAVNASLRPSGDTANDSNDVFSGGNTDSRMTPACLAARGRRSMNSGT